MKKTVLGHFSTYLLTSMPILYAFFSIAPAGVYNWLPVTTLFEVTFFSIAVLAWTKASTGPRLVSLAILVYVVIRLMAAIEFVPFEEIIRAHKWLLYIAALFLMLGLKIHSAARVARLARWLIILSFVKYLLFVSVYGLGSRPGIFTENNYELVLILGLFASTYRYHEKSKNILLGLLGVSILISESRSASIGFVIVILYVLSLKSSRNSFTRYLTLVAVGISTYIPFFVFQSRNTDFATLDRLNFFNSFLDETQSWQALDWIFGSPPLTQLTDYTCTRLSFYSILLSAAEDGSCYSVILHSFYLRVLFDFGILGFILSFAALFYIMQRAGVSGGLMLVLVGLAIANGISVSGQNNIYVILPILLAMLSAKKGDEDIFVHEKWNTKQKTPK